MGLRESIAGLGRFAHFAMRSAGALPGALTRFGDTARELHAVLVGALPLTAVAGLSLGIVVWLHLHDVLLRFGPGATELLPRALALAVVLELAPLGAAFIVAGRSGARIGAELASMRLTEQIDALEALGLSPMRILVAPRVLACMMAVPLLAVVMDGASLTGGWMAEWLGGTMTGHAFAGQCLLDLRLADALPATGKTIVFGFLIAVAGCHSGMTAHGGTEAVGEAATRAVVRSIFLIAVANVFLVRLTRGW